MCRLIVLLLYWLSKQNSETLQNPENLNDEVTQEKQLLIKSFVCSLVLLSCGLLLTDIDGLWVGCNRSPGHNPDAMGSWFWLEPPVVWLLALLGGQQLDAAKRRREESCFPDFWLYDPTLFLCKAQCSQESLTSWFNLQRGLQRVCVCSFLEVCCCVCLPVLAT